MAGRERNRVVVAAVAVLILAAGVYGPVALLAPLPSASATPVTPPAADGEQPGPALPAGGSSGVTLSVDAAPRSAGSSTPVPMAAATKLVTALVVLDAKPVEAGSAGETIVATEADFRSFVDYQAEGVRAVRVLGGEQWTEREAIQAMLVASSNNHAEMLARWAFGSIDAYLAAARTWLAAHDLTTVSVADTTGLDPASVGTGADLARIAALVEANPLLADVTSTARGGTLHGSPVENTLDYRTAEGIQTLSRSYTDEAGVCLIFRTSVEVAGTSVPVYASFLGEESYDQLDSDVDAFLASLPAAVVQQDAIAADSVWGRYTTVWGDSADAVASASFSVVDWAGTTASGTSVDLDALTTARDGQPVGALSVPDGTGTRTIPLRLDGRLSDPGPLWRLTNPGIVVPAFIGKITGG